MADEDKARHGQTSRIKRFDPADFTAPKAPDAETERLRQENEALQNRLAAAEEVLGDMEGQLTKARAQAESARESKGELVTLREEKRRLEDQILSREEAMSGGGITRFIPAIPDRPPGLRITEGAGDASFASVFASQDPDTCSNQLLAKISDASRQAQEMRAQVMDLCQRRDRLNELEPQLREVEKLLAGSNSERDRIFADLRKREEELKALRAETAAELKDLGAAKDLEIKTVTAQKEKESAAAAVAHEKLAADLSARKSEIESLQAIFKDTTSELAAEKESLAKSASLVSTLQQSLVSLQERNKASDEELSRLRPKAEKLAADLDQASSLRDTLGAKLEAALSDIARLDAELKKSLDDIKGRDDEVAKLREKIEKMEGAAQVDRDAREELATELAKRDAVMVELRAGLKSEQDSRDRMESDLNAKLAAVQAEREKTLAELCRSVAQLKPPEPGGTAE